MSGQTPGPVEAGDAEAASHDGWRWTLWVFGAILLVAVLHIALFKLESTQPNEWPRSVGWSHYKSERLTMWLAGIGAVGIVAYSALRRRVDFTRRRPRRISKVLLGLMVFIAGVNYFSARRSGKVTYLHTWDSFHYALGAKYYDELDYFRLYDCAAQALGPEILRDGDGVRHLEDYLMGTAAEARERSARGCRQRFTEERWVEFEHDVNMFVEATSKGFVRSMLKDHGYNGTPFHSVVASTIINRVPFTFASLTLLILMDVLAVLVALSFVCWAFGWRMGLLFAFHAFVLAIDRFAITGCSFLRYWWLASLIIGVCALHKKRFATAGALLTVASAFVVFPVLFVAGAGLSLGGAAWRRRRITRPLKRFVLGTVVAGVLCAAVGAASEQGFRNYTLFKQDMVVHQRGQPHPKLGSLVRSPGFGVGLKFVFHYRGRHSKKYKPITNEEFSRQVKRIEPVIFGVGMAITAFAAAVVVRLNPVEAASLFGVVGFFSLLGTTGYYFACANLLVLVFHRRRFAADGPLFVAVFMALSAVGLYIFDRTGVASIMYRTFISTTWTIFLCVVLSRFATLTGLWAWLGAPFRGDTAQAKRAWTDPVWTDPGGEAGRGPAAAGKPDRG